MYSAWHFCNYARTGMKNEMENQRITSENRPISSVADIGRLVRERRKEAGMTQAELAGYALTATRSVSEIERGKETAQADVIFRLIKALGIELEAGPR